MSFPGMTQNQINAFRAKEQAIATAAARSIATGRPHTVVVYPNGRIEYSNGKGHTSNSTRNAAHGSKKGGRRRGTKRHRVKRSTRRR